jgi:hypothetical protein
VEFVSDCVRVFRVVRGSPHPASGQPNLGLAFLPSDAEKELFSFILRGKHLILGRDSKLILAAARGTGWVIG